MNKFLITTILFLSACGSDMAETPCTTKKQYFGGEVVTYIPTKESVRVVSKNFIGINSKYFCKNGKYEIRFKDGAEIWVSHSNLKKGI